MAIDELNARGIVIGTRKGSADPAVYVPQLSKTAYAGLMMRIAFAADGELKDPPMTLYGYRDGIKVALD